MSSDPGGAAPSRLRPDDDEPGARSEDNAARGVEEPERRQPETAAEERSRERRSGLEEGGAQDRADEPQQRRPRRRRAAAQKVRRDPRPGVGPGHEPGERERADNEAAPPSDE